jgi:predicted PhzF superfamily epimerase YddE/YHI9
LGCQEKPLPKKKHHEDAFETISRAIKRGFSDCMPAAWMVVHRVARPDEPVLIEQGLEMNRHSRIFVLASRNNNRVVNVRVSGNAVEVMRGEVSL